METVVRDVSERLLAGADSRVTANCIYVLLGLVGPPRLWHGTKALVESLVRRHNVSLRIPPAMYVFVSDRLEAVARSHGRRGFEDPDSARLVLELMSSNSGFLRAIVELSAFFERYVSPEMPLNATWHPVLSDYFGVDNRAGLRIVAESATAREVYVASMKRHLSSEYTGFNRFAAEDWLALKPFVDRRGKFVDIGSGPGSSSLEVASALEMEGAIVLLDRVDPFRADGYGRIVDYGRVPTETIEHHVARRRIRDLQGELKVVQLYGVDIGAPIARGVWQIVQDASFVLVANVLPYVPVRRRWRAIFTALLAASAAGGVVRFHTDADLPLGGLVRSLTIRKAHGRATVLGGFTEFRRHR